jgi:gas vesicle protein
MACKNGAAIIAAFVGGAIAGAACGLLLAPEKGEDQRKKIKDVIDKYAAKLNKEEMNKILAEIKSIGKKKEANPAEDYDAE